MESSEKRTAPVLARRYRTAFPVFYHGQAVFRGVLILLSLLFGGSKFSAPVRNLRCESRLSLLSKGKSCEAKHTYTHIVMVP